MNVFWNQDMVGCGGVQPIGQMSWTGSGDVGFCPNVLKIEYGKQMRYCGKPGKKASMKTTRKMTFRRDDCVIVF